MKRRPPPSKKTPRSKRAPAGPSEPRAELERHVMRVQREIRSCAGCGMCCTEAYNAVQILPIEADRIARYLEKLDPDSRGKWVERLRRTVDRHRLGNGLRPRRYTCAFLEDDFRCGLPLDVKPVACLAFNPIDRDACDQEPQWYHDAHDPLLSENRARGDDERLRSIPVAVLLSIVGSHEA